MSTRSSALHCPECDAVLSEEAPPGLCPGCLVALALTGDDPATSPVPEPIAFGDYELIEELGRGGMGVVFRARQLSANREVALKTIHSGNLAGAAEIQRFHSEAEAAAQLDHPNIVPVYDVGECDGRHFFSMKLIEGPTLARLIEDGRFTPRNGDAVAETGRQRSAARLVATIAHAVQHAHDRAVLHRDLKPGNILLDARDEPHLTDFGLAKVIEADTDLTRTVAVLGTLEYMSPEQAGGHSRQATIAVDIYSLGVVLYELLTGRTPFRSPQPLEVLRRALEEEPARPRRLVASLDPDLENICLKCLEKSPAARYRTAQDLAQDLERWLAGEPIHARPSRPWERAVKFARRKPRVAAVGVLLTLAALALGGLAFYAARQTQNATSIRAEMARTTGQLQVQQARDWFKTENSATALARLARVVREDPANTTAAGRLLAAMTQRPFALPALQLAHAQEVFTAVHSPDGRRILTSCADGIARIWDATNGQLVLSLAGTNGPILDATFSADARRVATASHDGMARLWDAATGQSLATLPHPSWVRAAAFSPNGQQLLTLSTNLALLWQLDSLTVQTQRIEGPRARVAQFTAAGRPVVGADDGSVWIGIANGWNTSAQLTGHDAAVRSLAISRDDRRLASGSADGRILVRTLDSPFREIAMFQHAGPVVALQFDSAGRRLASASEDGTARVWILDPPAPAFDPIRHNGQVRSVSFSADGELLLTASDDGNARLWRLQDGQPASEPVRHPDFVDAARFSPDGQQFLTVCSDHVVRLWHIPRHQSPDLPLAAVAGEEPLQFECTPDGQFGIAISNEVLSVWNLRAGQLMAEPRKRSGLVTARIAPDAGSILELRTNGAWLTRVPSGDEQRLDPEGSQFGAFSAKARRVMAASTSQIRVWDLSAGTPLLAITCPEPIQDALISDDGTRVVAVSGQMVRLWAVGPSAPAPSTFPHQAPVTSVVLSPGADRMVVLADQTAYVWDVARRRSTPLRHAAPVRAAQFSPDGRWLITAAGPAAQIWEIDTATIRGTLPHKNEVNSAAFSPDGQRVVTATADQSIQAWDAAGHILTDPIPVGAPVWEARFTSCGRWLMARTEASPVFWEMPAAPAPAPAWLAELAEAIAGHRLDDAQSPTAVSPESFGQVRARLLSGTESDTNAYHHWARWFLSQEIRRPISPSAQRKTPR